MKLYDEIIERKQYLKEENRSPNVGNFRYKKSKELNYILKGVKAYRSDIYNISSIKGKIINLGGGDHYLIKLINILEKMFQAY